METMWFAAEMGLAGYGMLVTGIFAFQRHLMYHPLKSIASPAEYGLATVQDIAFKSADGVKLQAWIHPPKKGFPIVIYFHGNALNLSDRAPKFGGLVEAGFGLVAVSYRGFGKSDGSPSEAGIYNDARAAIAYARSHFDIPRNKLIYYGESLGSGVAVQMASEQAPGLLMLEAAYTSVETRSAELYPYILGVRQLVHDKYDSLSKIAKVRAPLLMIHGERDQVIPLAHGKALFAAAHNPKELIVYPEIFHADFTIGQTIVPLIASALKYGLIG